MTTGTAPLIDRQRDEVEAAADAATIAGLRQDMIDHLTRVVAEQMMEIRALRAAVTKAVALAEVVRKYKLTPDVDALDDTTFARPWIPEAYFQFVMAVDELRENGYLPAKEERP